MSIHESIIYCFFEHNPPEPHFAKFSSRHLQQQDFWSIQWVSLYQGSRVAEHLDQGTECWQLLLYDSLIYMYMYNIHVRDTFRVRCSTYVILYCSTCVILQYVCNTAAHTERVTYMDMYYVHDRAGEVKAFSHPMLPSRLSWECTSSTNKNLYFIWIRHHVISTGSDSEYNVQNFSQCVSQTYRSDAIRPFFLFFLFSFFKFFFETTGPFPKLLTYHQSSVF